MIFFLSRSLSRPVALPLSFELSFVFLNCLRTELRRPSLRKEVLAPAEEELAVSPRALSPSSLKLPLRWVRTWTSPPPPPLSAQCEIERTIFTLSYFPFSVPPFFWKRSTIGRPPLVLLLQRFFNYYIRVTFLLPSPSFSESSVRPHVFLT